MRTSAPPLLPLFRSEAQLEMLGLLVLQPSREWTLGDLSHRVKSPVSSVHREMHRAVAAGVVVRDDRQRPHTYRAATTSPAFRPLRQLLEMTSGVPEKLRRALSGMTGVRAVAIHGSWANQRVRPDSDLDVIVVSDGDRGEVQRVTRRLGRAIGRSVDASVLTSNDFQQMRDTKNPFLEKVLHGRRIDVIGDLDALGSPDGRSAGADGA